MDPQAGEGRNESGNESQLIGSILAEHQEENHAPTLQHPVPIHADTPGRSASPRSDSGLRSSKESGDSEGNLQHVTPQILGQSFGASPAGLFIPDRSTSAPPQLTIVDDTFKRAANNSSAQSEITKDYRLSAEYYNYYYSQRPLDPRLPTPLFDWSSWQQQSNRSQQFPNFPGQAGPPSSEAEPAQPAAEANPDAAYEYAQVSSPEPSTQSKPSPAQTPEAPENAASPTLPIREASPYQGDAKQDPRQYPQQHGHPQQPPMNPNTLYGPNDLTAQMQHLNIDQQKGMPPQPGANARMMPEGQHNPNPNYPPYGQYQGPNPGMVHAFNQQQGGPGYRQPNPMSPSMAAMGYGPGQDMMPPEEMPEMHPDMRRGQEYNMPYNGMQQQHQQYNDPYMRGWEQQQAYYDRRGQAMHHEHPGNNFNHMDHGRMRGNPRNQQYHHGRNDRNNRWSNQNSSNAQSTPQTYKYNSQYDSIYADNRDIALYGSTQGYLSGSFPRPKSKFSSRYSVDDEARQAQRRWIDDLRLNKGNSNYSLTHVINHRMVVELASDQYGSRFIQQKLETASPDEKQAAFDLLLPEVYTLCKDVFGNYVIQKFLEFGLPAHRKALIKSLMGKVLDLSLQMYGCRVVQKAIDVATVQEQNAIVRELTGHVMTCVKDQNGNHVIQKCIEKVPAQLIQFIVDSFIGQIFQLSTHPYGCRVIQRLLEHCTDEKRQQAILIEILDNTRELCKNQYGNYVIQHVLIHGTAWHRGAIINSLSGSVLALSKHKFASNVVEKCFAHATRQDRQAFVDEVLGDENDPNSPLISMVKDQFANYVVQKMIDVVDDEQRMAIINRIRRHIPNLRKIPYGKHIISRIERITRQPLLSSVGPGP